MTLRDRVAEAYVEMRDDVYRYLLTFGMSPAHAQDATQEVFLRMFTALKKGDDIVSLRGWAFRTAHNLGINTKTRQKTHEALDDAMIPAAGTSPERSLIEAERQARLTSAMAGLSPQQRQCLHLRAEGLRYREIAETIGISVSSVSEFVSRAIMRLRKAVHD